MYRRVSTARRRHFGLNALPTVVYAISMRTAGGHYQGNANAELIATTAVCCAEHLEYPEYPGPFGVV